METSVIWPVGRGTQKVRLVSKGLEIWAECELCWIEPRYVFEDMIDPTGHYECPNCRERFRVAASSYFFVNCADVLSINWWLSQWTGVPENMISLVISE